MIVVNRTRNSIVTAVQQKIVKKAIEWAAKSRLFDAVKIVNVEHAPGRDANGELNRNVRTCMARVTTNGTRELWINLATTANGQVTLGQVKRHVFSPEIAHALGMVKSDKADNSIARLRARNRRHGRDVATEQHTSRAVVFTIDLLRSLPQLVIEWLSRDITSMRGARVLSVARGQALTYDVGVIGIPMVSELIRYSTDLVISEVLPLRTWMHSISKPEVAEPQIA